MLESWHLLLTPYQTCLHGRRSRNFKICEFQSSSSCSVNYYFEKITKSSLQTFRRIIQSVLQILLQWRRSGIFIVSFEHILHFVLLFLLFVNFEHVIAGWVFSSEISELVLFFILVTSPKFKDADANSFFLCAARLELFVFRMLPAVYDRNCLEA